jgi:amino acid transporter
MVFYSYIGFDSVSTLGAEVKNPKRDMPLGIVGTLVLTTLMYVGVAFGMQSSPFFFLNRNAIFILTFYFISQTKKQYNTSLY